MTPEAKESIKLTFEANPDKEMLIATSDGQCFTNKGLAIIHAKSLADQELKAVMRRDYVEAEAEKEAGDKAEKEAGDKAEKEDGDDAGNQAKKEAGDDAGNQAEKEQTKELDTTGAVVKLTSDQRIEKINEATTLEELDILLKDEKAKTVIEAGKLKRESLTDH